MNLQSIQAVVEKEAVRNISFDSVLQALLSGRADSVSVDEYKNAGLHGIEARHIARLSSRIAALRPECFDSIEKLQGIVDHLRRFEGSANHIPLLEGDSLAAGVVAIARSHGLHLNFRRLSEEFSGHGVELLGAQMTTTLLRHGLQSKILQAKVETIHSSLLPCLLLMSDGGTLVLTGLNGSDYVLLSPVTGGEVCLSAEQLDARYSGITLFAHPINRALNRDDESNEKGRGWFISRLRRQWPSLIEVALASLLCSGLAVCAALFAMQVYDRVVPTAAFGTLWALAIGVLVAIGFDFVLRSVRAKIMETVGKRLDVDLSERIFSQVLGVRLDKRPTSTGAFANQIRDYETIREFFTATTLGAFGDIPFITLFLAAVALIGGPLVIVPVAAITLMLLPVIVMQRWLSKLSKEGLEEAAVKHGVLVETIEQHEAIKASRREKEQIAKWRRLNEEQLARGVQFREVHALLNSWAMTIQQMAAVFLIIFGVYRIDEGLSSIGALIACSILASRAIAPAAQVNTLLGRWQHVQVAIDGLTEFMARPVDDDPKRLYARLEYPRGEYRLEKLSWKYGPDSPCVLDIDDLKIAPGERIALLGGNGSGKTTLLRILAGLCTPSSGYVFLDDLSLSQVDPADIRRSVAYLPQDVGVFQGTLRDNLTPGGATVSDEELLTVASSVGLERFISLHPLGLDMPIPSSRSLSGGQRQAIGLARLMLTNPDIVLMDEPTAALDSMCETQVVERMLPWFHRKTIVVATHKRSVLQWATRSVVLKEGRVVADDPVSTVTPGYRGPVNSSSANVGG